MNRDRAAYMREYRASKRAAHEKYDEAKPLIGHLKTLAHEQAETIAALGEEVARLKRELAARPTPEEWSPEGMTMKSMEAHLNDPNRPTAGPIDAFMRAPAQFNSRPFRPVPKRGK